jgi:hypothetical protein
MPFTISIAINGRDVVKVDGYNAGPPGGDREESTRIYKYTATNCESGKVTTGEVLHKREDGIEVLSSLILEDLFQTIRSGVTDELLDAESAEVLERYVATGEHVPVEDTLGTFATELDKASAAVKWLEENQEGIDAFNERIERDGVFGRRHEIKEHGSLSDFFRRSPLRDAELDITRSDDHGREIKDPEGKA